jgi:hypothetical protein
MHLTWHSAFQSESGSLLASTLSASVTVGGLCHAAERPIRWSGQAVVFQMDTFHAIAEVGIAITGFAGIGAAIRGREECQADPRFRTRSARCSGRARSRTLSNKALQLMGSALPFSWRGTMRRLLVFQSRCQVGACS